MFKVAKLMLLIALSAVLMVQHSHASNVGGVFGPSISAGDRSAQYRSAYDPDNRNFVQRLHYQQALNSNLRLRGVFQARKTDNSDIDFDFFQGELQWQLKGNANWMHAVRFDARIRDRSRVGNIGFNWTNQFKLTPRLDARAIILGAVEVGNQARSGVFLQTRASLSHKLNDRYRLSAELFSDYGSTSDFRSSDRQIHQIGPAVSGNIADDWSFFSGVLFGANSASPDSSLRLWITKSFK